MTEYRCPFCGNEVTKDTVLFKDTRSTSAWFVDKVRYDFLMKASSEYPLEQENRFQGLYFSVDAAEDVEVTQRDKNGFPAEILVRPCDGLTPCELNDDMSAERETIEREKASKPESTEQRRLRTRACPHCHCSLPQKFGLIPTHSVCLFGGRASGKTAYLLSLFQQLLKNDSQLTACQLGTVSLLEESKKYFSQQMEIFETTGQTIPTPSGSRLFPLVLEYNNLDLDKAGFIVFYDIAGEGMDDADYLANHKGLRSAETIMLMIDPNMLCDGAFFKHVASQNSVMADTSESYDENEGYDDGAVTHDFYAEPVQKFLTNASAVSSYVNIKHLIAVMTKMDMPLMVDGKLFASKESVVRSNDVLAKHQGAVNRNVLGRMTEEMKNYINAKLSTGLKKVNIIDMIKKSFNHLDQEPLLLGVSTHTKTQESNFVASFEYLYTADAQKHRIIEPFLAILMYCGLAPYVGGSAVTTSGGSVTKESTKPAGKKKPWWSKKK